MRKNYDSIRSLLIIVILIFTSAVADDNKDYIVRITPTLPYVDVDIDGKIVRIQRIQNVKNRLTNSYAKTSRLAPPFSIQPILPTSGITPVGELELIDFLSKEVSSKRGVLIDARMPKWYNQGTIPGAINIPFTVMHSNAYKNIFKALGANGKDLSNVQEILVFDNGPWCQQATFFIKSIIEHGYPKSKIKYYRGGMQFWEILGLTTLETHTDKK